MSDNKPVQLGLCCMNTVLRAQKPSVYAARTMIVRTIQEKGIDELKRRITLNLQDLLTMIDWNEANGIKVFRLSSELFPHYTNKKIESYSLDFAEDLLRQIGEKARGYNHRLTFHPGQFNVLASPNENALANTFTELSYHATLLDMMGMKENSVMVIHGGGYYGDKPAAKKRWCENYRKLPDSPRNRLVLENCEKCFSIQDCLDISAECGVPVVFDTHHYDCYNKLHPDEVAEPAEHYIPLILETWTKRGIKPKFHVSEQGEGRTGHHSDYIEVIPDYLLEIPEKYGIEIDIMIEAKAKEQAIFKLYRKYPFLNCLRPKKLSKEQMKKKKLKVVNKISS